MSAAVANVFFGFAIDGVEMFGLVIDPIGWRNLILVWMGTVAIGVIISLPYGKIFRRRKNDELKVSETV